MEINNNILFIYCYFLIIYSHRGFIYYISTNAVTPILDYVGHYPNSRQHYRNFCQG